MELAEPEVTFKDISNGRPLLYSTSIVDMIAQGYLYGIRAIAIRTETSLEGLHI